MVVNKKSKTVSEIVQEYMNRQIAPQYKELGVRSKSGQEYSYSNVTNLNENFCDGSGRWLVFDSEYKGNLIHVKIMGWITRYVESVGVKVPEAVPRNYGKIIIYTHSGKREPYENVSNLVEDILDRKVEFDTIDETGKKVHIVKRPGQLEHSEEILEPS